nr:MAG TPA: hypothetical protein [Caudoviricetes sp.]
MWRGADRQIAFSLYNAYLVVGLIQPATTKQARFFGSFLQP